MYKTRVWNNHMIRSKPKTWKQNNVKVIETRIPKAYEVHEGDWP
jgi:hypothetical protein